MNKFFQKLVIAFITLYMIWYALPYFWHYYNDYQAQDLLSWSGYKSLLNVNGWSTSIISVAYLISAIGLLFLKKWARSLFLITTIFTMLPLWGYIVSPAVDGSIGFAISLIQGALLTLAYLTNLSNEFK